MFVYIKYSIYDYIWSNLNFQNNSYSAFPNTHIPVVILPIKTFFLAVRFCLVLTLIKYSMDVTTKILHSALCYLTITSKHHSQGGTPLNKPLIGLCVFLVKFRMLFFKPMWQYFGIFLLVLWKLHSCNLIKVANFLTVLVKLLSCGPLNSTTHIFTRLEQHLTIFDCGRIAGVCCPNQIKNHHFVIWLALTSYLSLSFIITNDHIELQSSSGHRFCLMSCLLFTELSRVTPNADVFSGVLHQVRKLKLPFHFHFLWCLQVSGEGPLVIRIS